MYISPRLLLTIIAIAVIAWVLFSREEKPPAATAPHTASSALTTQPTPSTTPPENTAQTTTGDPYAGFSLAHKDFYWRSFQWAMEYLKTDATKQFDTPHYSVTFIAGKRYQPEKELFCRPYAERLVRADVVTDSQAIACRRQGEAEQWCQFRQGQPTRCPPKPGGTLDNLSLDSKLKWHELKLNLGNQWHQLR